MAGGRVDAPLSAPCATGTPSPLLWGTLLGLPAPDSAPEKRRVPDRPRDRRRIKTPASPRIMGKVRVREIKGRSFLSHPLTQWRRGGRERVDE